MKKISLLIPFLVILISITSCKKDDSPSFVDDYNAPLTEEKGTKHNGDYFPLEAGYSWNYSGIQKIDGETIYSTGGYNETMPINETGDIYSSLSVEPTENINLESGTYLVYPLKESANFDYSYRYYEKLSDAIYFRAFTGEGGTILEVKNPVFLKIPLVVGDSWETQPSFDLESELVEGDLGVSQGEVKSSINCKIFVIGEETVNWNGNNASPIRLDEITEANFSIPINETGVSGKMDMNVKATNFIHLLEDVGIIKQELSMDVISTTSMSYEGEKLTIKINFETTGDLTLNSYNLTETVTKRAVTIFNEKGKIIKMSNHPALEKVANKVLKVANIVKKIGSL